MTTTRSAARKRRSAPISSIAQSSNENSTTTKSNADSTSGDGGVGSSSLMQQQQPAVQIRVRLKRFHAVAAWSWNANDDVCGICQASFEGCCPGVKYPGEDCPVVWGKCGHAYHLQCVSKWLSQTASKNSCPICRQEWEFGQNPVSSTAAPSAVSGP
jgi:anaphase-promoting complex subunit 11